MTTGASSGPRVSVVMAVYDRVDQVARAIDSVRAQDYPDVELVVIDGGSTDGTRELLERRRADIDYLHSGPDDGIYDAWNHGVSVATGRWLLFLGSDDWYASDRAISELVAAAEHHGTANLVVGRARQVLPGGRTGAVIGTRWSRSRMRLCMCIAHPATMTSRQLLDRFGPFDTSVGLAADYDLYLRASEHVAAVDVRSVIVDFSVDGATGTNVAELLRSTRTVQGRYRGIGRARAAVQYGGFRLALRVRSVWRAIRRPRRTVVEAR